MKRLLILALLVGIVTAAGAQEKGDTIRLKAGGNEVLIIKDKQKAEAIADLKNGRLEFKQDIAMLKDSIAHLKEQKEAAETDAGQARIEEEIEDKEKKIVAMEKGIERIDKEIAEIEGEELDEDDEFDINKDFNFDEWPFKKSKKKFDIHWAGFELGLNNFVNADNKMELPADGEFMELDGARSWNFGLNLLEFDFDFGIPYIGLGTGLGFNWNSFYLAQNVNLGKNANDVIVEGETNLDYKRNKFNVAYLTAPLLLEFQFPVGKENRKLFLGGGAVGALRINSAMNQKYRHNGRDYDVKSSGGFNIRSFRYDYRVQAGIDPIRIYASYSPVGLFEEDKGPEVHPVSIGIILFNF